MPVIHGFFLIFLISLVGCQSNERNQIVDPLSAKSLAKLDYSSNIVSHQELGGRVEVEISTARTGDDWVVIRGVFTPIDPDFHLYSSDLPREGIGGIGRPTLIEVKESDQIAEVGALVVDKTAFEKTNEVLNLSYAVYPAGAVTLYLPLRIKESSIDEVPISLELTYMSCSDTMCNPPVEGVVEEIVLRPSISEE